VKTLCNKKQAYHRGEWIDASLTVVFFALGYALHPYRNSAHGGNRGG